MKPGRELGTKIKYLMISQPFQNHSLMLGEIAAGSALNFTISSAYLKKNARNLLRRYFFNISQSLQPVAEGFQRSVAFADLNFFFCALFRPLALRWILRPRASVPKPIG